MTYQSAFGRRIVLRSAVAGLAGTLLAAGTSACTPTSNTPAPGTSSPSENASSPSPTPSGSDQGSAGAGGDGGRVLLAYFSRAGENYYYGERIDLEVGNTEVLAGMIKQLTGCDVYRIEEADPYPDS
jgi:hypothetical protein